MSCERGFVSERSLGLLLNKHGKSQKGVHNFFFYDRMCLLVFMLNPLPSSQSERDG